MSKHALYRFFDDQGDLLYVGITMNPSARWPQHKRDKHWWHQVENITLEVFGSRKEVLDAETEAIKTEHPRYNVVHNDARDAAVITPAPDVLSWTCGACPNLVDDGDGLLWVSAVDYEGYRDDLTVWREVHGDGGHNLAAFMAHPEPAQWLVAHFDCLPAFGDEEHLYSFPIERARTPSAVLGLTAFLMGKTWLSSTDWDLFLVKAAKGGC